MRFSYSQTDCIKEYVLVWNQSVCILQFIVTLGRDSLHMYIVKESANNSTNEARGSLVPSCSLVLIVPLDRFRAGT